MSMKIIRHNSTPLISDGNKKGKKKMLNLSDIPSELRHSYMKEFCPQYIKRIGLSTTPWFSPGPDVKQQIFNKTFPNIRVELQGKDAANDVVSPGPEFQ